MMMTSKAPIIIIGMHRSGTSFVTRALMSLGCYMGANQDQNAEAWFFIYLNRWLLHSSGASWDTPTPIHALYNNPAVRSLTTDYLAHMLRSPRSSQYLGMWRYLRYRSLFQLPFRWGWKDPRNTFTLPLWLDLFPSARVICVYRHGVDVAASLQRREKRRLQKQTKLHAHKKRRKHYWIKPKQDGFLQSLRCTDLSGGFSLWDTYMQQIDTLNNQHGIEMLTIKYEDLLTDPLAHLQTLSAYCDLPVSETDLQAIAGRVQADRAFAYRDTPEHQAFAQTVSAQLAKWDYDA